MTAQRAAADPSVREFAAPVASVDGRDVVLERTYFYAESGGQPADRGTIDGLSVDHVETRDGSVVHTLELPPDFEAGDDVVGVVDDPFRTYCMRAHTASHVLYGAGRRVLDDLGYGGFDIDAHKVRVDFETTTEIDDATLVELERLVNRVVWDSLSVFWEEVPVGEARADDAIAFNTKTEEGVFDSADTVRVVTIGGASDDTADADADAPTAWDVAACGGTHVSNTREMGPIEVLDRSNPGEGMTRVEFAVGPAAIDHRASVRSAAMRTASELGTSLDEMPDLVRTLRAEKDEMADELAELRDEVVAARLAGLNSVDRDGHSWRVGVVEGFGPNDVGDRLQALVGDESNETDVAVVAGEQGSTFVVVATGGEIEAGDVVEEVTDEFGGGGGGSPTFAQGGGLSADPAGVVAYLTGQ